MAIAGGIKILSGAVKILNQNEVSRRFLRHTLQSMLQGLLRVQSGLLRLDALWCLLKELCHCRRRTTLMILNIPSGSGSATSSLELYKGAKDAASGCSRYKKTRPLYKHWVSNLHVTGKAWTIYISPVCHSGQAYNFCAKGKTSLALMVSNVWHYHRTVEWWGLERTLRSFRSNPPGSGQGHFTVDHVAQGSVQPGLDA